MESILELDDKKVFIYNILQDYSTNTKLMNDILQIVDKYTLYLFNDKFFESSKLRVSIPPNLSFFFETKLNFDGQ